MIRRTTIRDDDALFALWSETEDLGLRAPDDLRRGIDGFPKSQFDFVFLPEA